MLKPMLFNTDMVRAILAGKKTVTRRVMKPQPKWSQLNMRWDWGDIAWWRDNWNAIESIPEKNKPLKVGDILYVRETWRVLETSSPPRRCVIEYKAGGTQTFDDVIALPTADGKWRPSIHMPKEAARIFLMVKSVRVERLQDITDEEIVAEGLEIGCYFDELWDSTIKPADRDTYGWEANPWVWVIEFERCEKPEEA